VNGPGGGRGRPPAARRIFEKDGRGASSFLGWPHPEFLIEVYEPKAEDFWLDPAARAALLGRFVREEAPGRWASPCPGPDPSLGERAAGKLGDGSFFQVVLRGGGRIEFPSRGRPRFYTKDGRPFGRDLESLDPEELFYLDPWAPWNWTREGQAALAAGAEWARAPYGDFLARVLEVTGPGNPPGAVLYDPASQLMEWLGFETFVELLVAEPDLAEECLRALERGTVALGEDLARAGAAFWVLAAPHTGADTLSKKAWERFVGPIDGDLVRTLSRGGLGVYALLPPSWEDRKGEILSLGFAGWIEEEGSGR